MKATRRKPLDEMAASGENIRFGLVLQEELQAVVRSVRVNRETPTYELLDEPVRSQAKHMRVLPKRLACTSRVSCRNVWR